ncbi:uncharacterized protein AC631_00020 [Debaryomyces fabryi]|uniref:Vacuolar protein sorting-associated protein 75 n=1 Tax=Debaryomyces fabryi TaxID=58627 RepID=A0A0V1Q785_9ASCO|nr:uncharacterized protein AC631_00020 [Debaryomyces fabryi]KSA04149.1 hypothetical protein AC631_00020 [Debaryomyces fabryi]CUM46205.1 unnamed protein product [Debaryomyces fabryi]
MSKEQDSVEKDSQMLEQYLIGLAECEQEMDKAEIDASVYRIRKTQSIYKKRRQILTQIPQFWYIVLAENDDFPDYVTSDDLKYIEYITDIYVHYKVADSESSENPRDFSITVSFKDDENDEPLVATQEITKHFHSYIEDGEEKLSSSPVSVEWPKELSEINPTLIKKNKGKDLSSEDKKNYRLGMKSFFSWFSWTGTKPGKEFRSGDDLTRLVIDDLFPYAVKYYTEALPGDELDDEDSSEGEELDISEEDDDENDKIQKDVSDSKKRAAKLTDQPSKKKK